MFGKYFLSAKKMPDGKVPFLVKARYVHVKLGCMQSGVAVAGYTAVYEFHARLELGVGHSARLVLTMIKSECIPG